MPSFDLGGFFIQGLRHDVPATIAATVPVRVTYALHPELDGIGVLPQVDDVFLWTSEHLGLARNIRAALGCVVVACAYEESGGLYQVFIADAREQHLSTESPFPFVVAARTLGVTMDRLVDLLEGPGCEPDVLPERIDEVEKDERRLHPGRRAMTLYVTKGIADELD